MVIPEHVKQDASIELAQRFFWDFEQLLYPELFTDDRKLLKEMADTIQDFIENSEKHYLVLSVPPGHYKALDIKTPVLTIDGWKEHGKLVVGDYVFSDTGKPVMVTEVHPTHSHSSMKLKTASGDEIVASDRHLWKVHTSRERVKDGKKIVRQEEILETKDILTGYHKRRPYIKLASALDLPSKELPIDPYIFGAWIGDGSKDFGIISVGDEDIDYFSQFGKVRKVTSGWVVTIDGLRTATKRLGVYRNKHIPTDYLLGSYEQRLQLLKGLMDTDGTVHKDYHRCTFVQKDFGISRDVMSLCRSLGIKSIMRKYKNKQYGTDYYQVSFTTDLPVFNLPRKRDRQLEHLHTAAKTRNNQAYIHSIESIEPCGDKIVNCITVDGGMYLAGYGLLPTHNSFTAKNLAMWLMGKDPMARVIGVSNSGDMASMFSTQIRDTILGTNVGKGGTSYPKIFPKTKIKAGFATKSKWELEGSAEPSYRATSPTSAITGSRADYIIVDDIIKHATEAMNANALEDHFNFYKNTLFTRTDGDDYKFIFVMQRWATNDLSGKIINLYGDDVVQVSYSIETDGKMLEPSITSAKKFEEIKRTLDPTILKANYYQKPVDIEGRLYKGFEEWTTLPDSTIRKNTTDVADQGKDYLCSINWFDVKDEDGIKVYITDIYYSNEKAEITEPNVAKMLTADNVTIADFESNNGGKGYARNVERELIKLDNLSTVVQWTPQTSNKEARILSSSAWVAKNVYMPPNWTTKYKDFAGEVLTYVAGGKNPHDDGVDVLATIYERAANFEKQSWAAPRFG